jgi:hypothetical protein
VICALAAAAPAASAQTEPFSATYTEKFVGPSGNPSCPDDAFACGSGTATELGAFSTELTFDENCGCVIRTLTFSDASTLMLDESLSSFTAAGGSGSSKAPGRSEGHPGTYVSSWTVNTGTGNLNRATGSGTDTLISAGLIGTGTLTGTVTTPTP